MAKCQSWELPGEGQAGEETREKWVRRRWLEFKSRGFCGYAKCFSLADTTGQSGETVIVALIYQIPPAAPGGRVERMRFTWGTRSFIHSMKHI